MVRAQVDLDGRPHRRKPLGITHQSAFSGLPGKQISLISKKNIRYLGTLYSINEQNATVALQNVRSFGTEGRPGQPVEASSDVHPFLVFRGQDITDLHVHEDASATAAATTEDASAAAPETAAPAAPQPASSTTTTTTTAPAPSAPKSPAPPVVTPPASSPNKQQGQKENDHHKQPGRGGGGRGRGRRGPRAAPGTGASLLNRPTRGTVAPNTESIKEDFDFQSNLKDFQDENDEEEEDDAGDEPHAYEKDDFFDSISCEATDRQAGVDNRLRGREERDLNTETFGAVALSQRRRRGGRGGRGGRGRGRGGGHGGRGGGRGRGGRGRGFRRDEGMPRPAQTS